MIQFLKAKNVYILGGTAAVNSSIEEKLKKYATVTRVAGKDRFETAVKKGDTVRAGEKLLTFDRDKIRAAGHPDTVVVLLMNADDIGDVSCGVL